MKVTKNTYSLSKIFGMILINETLFEVYKPLDSGKLTKLGSIHIANINAYNWSSLLDLSKKFDTEEVYDNLSEEFISFR